MFSESLAERVFNFSPAETLSPHYICIPLSAAIMKSPRPPRTPVSKLDAERPAATATQPAAAGFIWRRDYPYFVLSLLGLLLYCNTFTHNWAYDDLMVILKNGYVQQGVSGIPKLIGGDSFQGFSESMNEGADQLTGGRYRPLSLVTFAIEQQILGIDVPESATSGTGPEELARQKAAFERHEAKIHADMEVRHVVNVLLYIVSVLMLYHLLAKFFFTDGPLGALVVAMLFLVHPVHTEVVANVKGRDEVLSFLFIVSTLYYSLLFAETQRGRYRILGCLTLLLALLSKEYAVVMVVVLPVTLWVFHKGYSPLKSIQQTVVYWLPVAAYLLLRTRATHAGQVIEGDIMNNPYCWATPVQKLASECAVLFRYAVLAVFPHPLSADYSYKQIPYSDFSDIKAWLGIVLYAVLAVWCVVALRKRSSVGWGLAVFLLFLLPVSNIIVNVGTPMGDRFLYHASLGVVILLGVLGQRLYTGLLAGGRQGMAKYGLGGLLGLILVAGSVRTVARNADWASNSTLFLHDVAVVPNSVIANTNAGVACTGYSASAKDTAEERRWLRRGIGYFDHCIALDSKYVSAYINRGFDYYKLGLLDSALNDCDAAIMLYPTHPDLAFLSNALSEHYARLGYDAAVNHRFQDAVQYCTMSLRAKPDNYDVAYNLAFALCQNQQYAEGRKVLVKLLNAKPDHKQAADLLRQLDHALEAQGQSQ